MGLQDDPGFDRNNKRLVLAVLSFTSIIVSAGQHSQSVSPSLFDEKLTDSAETLEVAWVGSQDHSTEEPLPTSWLES